MERKQSPKSSNLQDNRRAERGTMGIDNKDNPSSGIRQFQWPRIYAAGGGKKERSNRTISRKGSPKGVAPQPSRLSKLEEALVAQTKRTGTPFNHITAQSNPGTSLITSYPAVQWWWETYRTIRRESQAGVIYVTQDVVVGSVILVSRTLEAEARYECYMLEEELETRIIGFMPDLGGSISLVTPLADADSMFSQMDSDGLYALTTMWDFQWIVGKGAKP
jgi:hypothetical protein